MQKTYIIAMVSENNGREFLDTGKRYTLPEAMKRAEGLNTFYQDELKALDFDRYVAYNLLTEYED